MFPSNPAAPRSDPASHTTPYAPPPNPPGANDGVINLAAPNAPRSLVVYDDRSGAPMACCDLAAQRPLSTDWKKALLSMPGALPCGEEDMEHSAHAPAAAKAAPAPVAANASRAAATAAAPMDHSAHAGHNMNRRLLSGFAAAWKALVA